MSTTQVIQSTYWPALHNSIMKTSSNIQILKPFKLNRNPWQNPEMQTIQPKHLSNRLLFFPLKFVVNFAFCTFNRNDRSCTFILHRHTHTQEMSQLQKTDFKVHKQHLFAFKCVKINGKFVVSSKKDLFLDQKNCGQRKAFLFL